MIIDLHIHSNCSDGTFTLEEIVQEARIKKINFLSITDHDSISSQGKAINLAESSKIRYVSGVELNVTFSHPEFREGKSVSLDFLGYQFDHSNEALRAKLDAAAKYREERATRILENLNAEFTKEGLETLTKNAFKEIGASADGAIGRPHIADYLVKKKIVETRQEAFNKYLVKCDVPKYPLHLKEASKMIREAGGKLVLAHPNDPNGTSLIALTKSLVEQTDIVKSSMLDYIDGIECWHSRSDSQTTNHYVKFAKEHELILTGGSDCHQKPVLMGTVEVPSFVADQF